MISWRSGELSEVVGHLLHVVVEYDPAVDVERTMSDLQRAPETLGGIRDGVLRSLGAFNED